MNIHNPARYEGESQADYRLRRAASKEAVYRMTHPPRQAKASAAELGKVNPKGWWLGQGKAPATRKIVRGFNRLMGARQARKARWEARNGEKVPLRIRKAQAAFLRTSRQHLEVESCPT